MDESEDVSTFPHIRGLLFDKDGTIFDFQKSWGPVNLRAARHASGGDEALRIRLLEIGGADPRTGHVAADSLLAVANATEIAAAWIAAGSPFDSAELTTMIDRIFFDGAANMAPAADLAALFGRFAAKGLRLGIASSDSAAAVRAAAERFGFMQHMDFLCGYDSGHGHKPTEGMPLAFCRACGLSPGEIAVIGDSLHDMEMGRRAGAALRIGVLTGAGTAETLAPFADTVIPGIDCLEDLLGLS
jgi:phosphoglycolate phosphatase